MLTKTEISAIKRNFRIVLADETPVFDPINRALIEELNNCENLPSLLPEAHVRRKSVNNSAARAGKIIDISRAGQEAISACQFVGFQDIAAKLVPMTKSIVSPCTATTLFARLLDGSDADFANNYLVMEPAFYLSTKTTRNKSRLLSMIEFMKEMSCVIPDEHIRKYDLCDIENDIQFAMVVQYSIYATAMVQAWFRCNARLIWGPWSKPSLIWGIGNIGRSEDPHILPQELF